jgi:hypothetical protein
MIASELLFETTKTHTAAHHNLDLISEEEEKTTPTHFINKYK